GFELGSERGLLLLAGIHGVLRFPQLRGLSLHGVEEDGGGLVAGHVRSPPVSRQNELVHPTLYKSSSAGIKGENKSFAGEQERLRRDRALSSDQPRVASSTALAIAWRTTRRRSTRRSGS